VRVLGIKILESERFTCKMAVKIIYVCVCTHCNWIFIVGRKYSESPWTCCVSTGVIWQPGDWRLPVYTSDIPVSSATHTTRTAVSVCTVAAEVGNAVGTGFPSPLDAATWCRVSMYVMR